MANLTRVSQMALSDALNGDTAVADALGNVMNGSAANGYDPIASSGKATGIWSSIGTQIYVEITLVLTGSATPTVSLPFTHQGLSSQRGVIPGASAAGVAITGVVDPDSAILTLRRYDGAALGAGTYFLAGIYQSSVG
jgi:hypothetical protein